MLTASFALPVLLQVPTIAVENVYVWNNTSIVQDEVLAQRLGLIPLAIDPRKLEMKQGALRFLAMRSRAHLPVRKLSDTSTYRAAPDEVPTDLNTVVFSLVARCTRNRDVKKGETDPAKIWTGIEGEPGALRRWPVISLLICRPNSCSPLVPS